MNKNVYIDDYIVNNSKKHGSNLSDWQQKIW